MTVEAKLAVMKDFTFGDPASPPVLLLGYLGGVRPVLLEDSRWRKLPELVAHHVFGDEHRVKNFSVMDEERVSHEIGNNRGAARPGFDRLLAVVRVLFVDLFQQMLLDERSFFEAASHRLECGFLGCFLTLQDEAIARLVFAAGLETLRELAPGRHRVMA